MSTSTSRLSLTKPASSENVNITTLDTNFDLLDAAVGSTAASASTKPASAFSGRIWYETDTGRLKVNTAASASTAATWVVPNPTDVLDWRADYYATGDGTTDNSSIAASAYAAAAAAIDASQSAYFGTNRRGKKIIEIPAGTFKVISASAFMSDLGIARTTGLTIRGQGRDVTNVVFAPVSADQYLMHNNDDWLNITFEDMTFHSSASTASFMKSISSGGAQNYAFNRVNWSGAWKYGIELEGSNTNSEFSFFHCEVKNDWTAFLYSTAASGSDQFLNYNFFGCQIEYSSGNFIDMAKGGNINVWGGSLIHEGSAASTAQTFFKLRGTTHSSAVERLTVIGARVEHRHSLSKLIDSEWGRGSIYFGGLDTESHSGTTGASSWVTASFADTTSSALSSVVWESCRLMGKHSYAFRVSSHQFARRFVYRSSELVNFSSAHDFVTVVNSDATGNIGSNPTIKFQDCRTTGTSGGSYPIDCTLGWELAKNAKPTEHRVSIKKPSGALPVSSGSLEEVWLPKNAIITNVRWYMPATGSSTSTTWSYTLADSTPTTIAAVSPGTQWKNGFSESDDVWFVCSDDTKRHLTLTAANITEGSTLGLCVVTYIA